MEKWGLALSGLGCFLIMIASSTTPANMISLGSGIFYVALGIGMILYKKKKSKKGV